MPPRIITGATSTTKKAAARWWTAGKARPKRWSSCKDWNDYEILCDGDHIQLTLNGLVTADLHDSARLEGIIAFQLHRGPPMEVYFRNVRIKILP